MSYDTQNHPYGDQVYVPPPVYQETQYIQDTIPQVPPQFVSQQVPPQFVSQQVVWQQSTPTIVVQQPIQQYVQQPVQQYVQQPVQQYVQQPVQQYVQQIESKDPETRLKELAAKYEINDYYFNKLKQLYNYEIVLICDDSGSMQTPIDSSGNTRWTELKQTVKILTEITTVFDPNGVDIYFLNRPPLTNVTDHSIITQAFDNPPNGLTPICPVIRKVFEDKKHVIIDRKLLVIIATDGVPTDTSGYPDEKLLKRILETERTDKMYVTFMACTDDKSTLNYMNNWDKTIPRVDVVDDYNNEKQEIKKIKGQDYKFSYGDWVVKSLIGSIDASVDNLDETSSNSNKPNNACCIIC